MECAVSNREITVKPQKKQSPNLYLCFFFVCFLLNVSSSGTLLRHGLQTSPLFPAAVAAAESSSEEESSDEEDEAKPAAGEHLCVLCVAGT